MADPLNISFEQARAIVQSEIQRKGAPSPTLLQSQEASTQEALRLLLSLREEHGQVIHLIATGLYSSKERFILELIQNIEDSDFRPTVTPSIHFEASPQRIVVTSNQDGFNERDVVQLCSTGNSWKRGVRGYVGEKGIGFKSVFQVASRVSIDSNAFSFYFEYNGGGSGEDNLGMITPFHGDTPIPLSQRPLTRMTLRLHNRAPYANIYAEFESIPETLLLFLTKVREIRFKLHHPEEGQVITNNYKRSPETDGVITITKSRQGAVVRTAQWSYHIVHVHVTGLEPDSARPGINECESVLAFPIDQRGDHKYHAGHDIYAFLPVCTVGFNFILQADFILQASRQEVVSDSPWNKIIIDRVAEAFCNTMIRFSKLPTLRFTWMRYLPLGRQFETNQLWRSLSRTIRNNLAEKNVLYFHDPNNLYAEESLATPTQVKVVPNELLDPGGLPLFTDRPGINRQYLSLRYEQADVQILRDAFSLRDIEDLHIIHRVKQDLGSPTSRTKDPATSSEWHTRASNLMKRICSDSQGLRRMVDTELDLVPLADGSWIFPATRCAFFPARTGPALPPDLLTTICPQADSNLARRELFALLGSTICSPAAAIDLIWPIYTPASRHEITLEFSKSHLQYLYWHCEHLDGPRITRLWLYSHTLQRVSCHSAVMYLPSNDELGPSELLRAVPNPQNPDISVPSFNVPFVNPFYMDAFSPDTRRHNLSWLAWLERVMKVRRILSLTYSAGALSPEFRHVLQRRQDKIVPLLRQNWSVYGNLLVEGDRNSREIENTQVACSGNNLACLWQTYFPCATLLQEYLIIGNPLNFPFLALPNSVEQGLDEDGWLFLRRRFGVLFDTELDFFLDGLRCHSRNPNEALTRITRDGILKCYENISDFCTELNKPDIIQMFTQHNLILHPSSFSTNLVTWANAGDCFWRAPDAILEKVVLSSTALYHSNRRLQRLFCEILDIKNAAWRDSLSMLCNIRQRPAAAVGEISDQVTSLYMQLAVSTLSDEDKVELLNSFETHSLVKITDEPFWAPPSRCIWTSPVPIPNKITLEPMYSAELRLFFGDCLRVSPAELSTLVQGLLDLVRTQPSITDVRSMLFAINAESPSRDDLLRLLTCRILPIRRFQQGSMVLSLQNMASNFAIVDRSRLSDLFRNSAAFLDFSLEEVRQLNPLLQSLGLNGKLLSRISVEETACTEHGVLDTTLTQGFQDRASYLVRCAVSHSSALARYDPIALCNRLAQITIRRSSGLSTKFTLRYENGETIGPVVQPVGHVHIQAEGETWQIYVPLSSMQREVCYRGNLPQSLAKLFRAENDSINRSISNVLNASLEVIEDLLEQDGIVNVPGLPAPPRRNQQEEQEPDALQDPQAPNEDSDNASSNGFEVVAARANNPRGRQQIRLNPGLVVDQQNNNELPRVRQEPPHQNAYHILLDSVKRIASQISFRSRHAIMQNGNEDFIPGFDHNAAFGFRSQGQFNHDVKIGAAGELFIYECLRNNLLPGFDWDNWTSTIKVHVLTHPDYVARAPWPGRREVSDLQYSDNTGSFTRRLIEAGYLDELTWRDARPEYLFEVKTTTGGLNDRFFMSSNQIERMESLALQQGHVSDRIYVILRVYNLGRENMNVEIYIDPEAHRGVDLTFAASTWTVTPVR